MDEDRLVVTAAVVLSVIVLVAAFAIFVHVFREARRERSRMMTKRQLRVFAVDHGVEPKRLETYDHLRARVRSAMQVKPGRAAGMRVAR